MAILSNQRRGAGTNRYSFSNDMGLVMGWLEQLVVAADQESLYLEGALDRAQVNRIRGVLGMAPISTSVVRTEYDQLEKKA